MNVACPECTHVYRVDPDRIAQDGVRTRCRDCSTPFVIARGAEGRRPGDVVEGRRVVERTDPEVAAQAPADPASARRADPPAGAPQASTSTTAAAPAFGPQDPQTRARRLARALVSDIKVYNQKRWAESQARGTLRKDFRDEILKSWDEYVEQVGEALAKGTPYFRDALNDILGGGQRVF